MFSFYIQPATMDCGPTCLRMLAKHYKRNISLQYLRDKTQIGKEGINLLDVCEAAEAVGFFYFAGDVVVFTPNC